MTAPSPLGRQERERRGLASFLCYKKPRWEKNWYIADLEKSSEVSQVHHLNRNSHLPGLSLPSWLLCNLMGSSLFLGYAFKLISGLNTWLNRTLPLECWESAIKSMKNVTFLFEATLKLFAAWFYCQVVFPLHVLAFFLPSQTKIRVCLSK